MEKNSEKSVADFIATMPDFWQELSFGSVLTILFYFLMFLLFAILGGNISGPVELGRKESMVVLLLAITPFILFLLFVYIIYLRANKHRDSWIERLYWGKHKWYYYPLVYIATMVIMYAVLQMTVLREHAVNFIRYTFSALFLFSTEAYKLVKNFTRGRDEPS